MQHEHDIPVTYVPARNTIFLSYALAYAEVLESRKFHIEEACRMLGVPPHLVGHTEKNSSWGTGMQDLTQGFLRFTLRPRMTRITQAVSRDLITYPRKYYVEHDTSDLLRADAKTRFETYAIAKQWGWITTNEIRHRENLPAVEGGDELTQPLNMGPIDSGSQDQMQAIDRQFAKDAVGRVVRSELNWLKQHLHTFDENEVKGQVEQYYERRAETLTKQLYLDDGEASTYISLASKKMIEAREQDRIAEALDDWSNDSQRHLLGAVYKCVTS